MVSPLCTARYLQFGHGCDAVETTAGAVGVPPSRALQFGHGCDAVETSKRPSAPPPPRGPFNSATAVMPWKP